MDMGFISFATIKHGYIIGGITWLALNFATMQVTQAASQTASQTDRQTRTHRQMDPMDQVIKKYSVDTFVQSGRK